MDDCHACGSALPAGAAWCSLCFTEVRRPPAPVTSAAPEAAAPEVAIVSAGWSCPRCGTAATALDVRCAACGAGLLEPSPRRVTRLPLLGDPSQLSTGRRAAAGAIAALAVAAVLVLLASIAGLALQA
ncbi:MAG TPA: zinc ribbon domain-containing protein [Mycobacteriales bacterium]|nr:zinc ribbon domain-containing protein [Mycobacteriales bacterium]